MNISPVGIALGEVKFGLSQKAKTKGLDWSLV